jgi:hypothetical protein
MKINKSFSKRNLVPLLLAAFFVGTISIFAQKSPSQKSSLPIEKGVSKLKKTQFGGHFCRSMEGRCTRFS